MCEFDNQILKPGIKPHDSRTRKKLSNNVVDIVYIIDIIIPFQTPSCYQLYVVKAALFRRLLAIKIDAVKAALSTRYTCIIQGRNCTNVTHCIDREKGNTHPSK